MHFDSQTIILLSLSYLLGSIPFGLIVGKITKIGDIRQSGSGNIGATNMTRVGGKKLGAIVLVLDALKGVVAVMIAQKIATYNTSIWCGMMAVIGHIFPVWLLCKGGKGVATTFAVYTVLMWQMGLAVIAVWLTVFIVTRISSLSAIIAMCTSPFLAYFMVGNFSDSNAPDLVYVSTILTILVIVRHHQNIKNLIHKKEGHFRHASQKGEKQPPQR